MKKISMALVAILCLGLLGLSVFAQEHQQKDKTKNRTFNDRDLKQYHDKGNISQSKPRGIAGQSAGDREVAGMFIDKLDDKGNMTRAEVVAALGNYNTIKKRYDQAMNEWQSARKSYEGASSPATRERTKRRLDSAVKALTVVANELNAAQKKVGEQLELAAKQGILSSTYLKRRAALAKGKSDPLGQHTGSMEDR